MKVKDILKPIDKIATFLSKYGASIGVAVIVIGCITMLQVLIFKVPKRFFDRLWLSNVILGFVFYLMGRNSKDSDEEKYDLKDRG
jgi:hypothetical protein